MTSEESNWVRHREIHFAQPHPDQNQAATAHRLFQDLACIHASEVVSPTLITLSYDLRCTCLCHIEQALQELGFHLDNSLLNKLKRALYYYTEDAQRENFGPHHGQDDSTREVFINRYEKIHHGCRDSRTNYWRKYL